MPLAQYSVHIIPQDQNDDEPTRFTTPAPLLRNQAILVTPASCHNPLKFTVFSDYEQSIV